MSESIFSAQRSKYSIQEYNVHHRYITTATMSGVMMTTMIILMIYYATKNYPIRRSLTDVNLQMVIQVKSLAWQSCPNCSVHCQCRGPRGAFVCFCSRFCCLTEELLNRCCFTKGSICFGFNPNPKTSREL